MAHGSWQGPVPRPLGAGDSGSWDAGRVLDFGWQLVVVLVAGERWKGLEWVRSSSWIGALDPRNLCERHWVHLEEFEEIWCWMWQSSEHPSTSIGESRLLMCERRVGYCAELQASSMKIAIRGRVTKQNARWKLRWKTPPPHVTAAIVSSTTIVTNVTPTQKPLRPFASYPISYPPHETDDDNQFQFSSLQDRADLQHPALSPQYSSPISQTNPSLCAARIEPIPP
ncbi:hypothetical protein V8F20_011484 [Naviculisporaceae sp. PSN 640]